MAEHQAVWEDGARVDAPQFYDDPTMGSKFSEMDSKLIVSFFLRVERNNFESAKAGRAIHATVDFIQIVVPGDRLRVVERKAMAYDKERFAAKWAAYRAGKQEAISGTPLSAWGAMDPAVAADYAAMKVTTVEQLADADELLITNLGMGGREWKQRAQAFLAATGQSKTLLEEIAALKERLAAVEAEDKKAAEYAADVAAPKVTPAKLPLDATGKPVPPFAVTK